MSRETIIPSSTTISAFFRGKTLMKSLCFHTFGASGLFIIGRALLGSRFGAHFGEKLNSTALGPKGISNARLKSIGRRSQRISGAKIKISDRGDFMSGTSDRKVTITGTSEAIRTAEAMIMQKVSANAD